MLLSPCQRIEANPAFDCIRDGEKVSHKSNLVTQTEQKTVECPLGSEI